MLVFIHDRLMNTSQGKKAPNNSHIWKEHWIHACRELFWNPSLLDTKLEPLSQNGFHLPRGSLSRVNSASGFPDTLGCGDGSGKSPGGLPQ